MSEKILKPYDKLYDCPFELIIIEPKGKHTGTFIFLHGLGDSGFGWKPLLNHWSEDERFSHIRFILPSANKQPVTINQGYIMPAWFDIRHEDKRKNIDAEGISKTCTAIHKLIEREMRNSNIESTRIGIGGFSQGGSIALYAGLTFNQPLAGILGLSAYIPNMKDFENEMSKESINTQVMMCHGILDTIVPLEIAKLGCQLITKCRNSDKNLIWKVYSNLGHSSSKEEIKDVVEWLLKVIQK